MPLAINLYGTDQRMAWALGVDDVDEITQRVRNLLGMIQGPPEGIVPKLKALGDLAGVCPLPGPRSSRKPRARMSS